MASLVEARGLGATGVVPLAGREGVIGFLAVHRGEGDVTFDDDERAMIDTIATIVGRAIERAELHDAERTARLEADEARRSVEQLLATAAADRERLRESEERFRRLADQAPLPIWVHDPSGAQEWVNLTFCEYFGVARDDMHAHRWQSLIHPHDEESYAASFAAAIAQRQPFHAHARVRRHDDEWRWLESWGQPRFDHEGRYLGHIGTSADVSDRVEAAEELAAAHAFASEVTALVPGVISVVDLVAGRNVFVNRQSFDLLGCEPHEVVELGDRFVPTVLHPDDTDVFTAHIDHARRMGHDAVSSVEYRFRHRDGSWRWFRTDTVPLRRDSNGAVTQIASLTIDVTEHKEHEAALHEQASRDAFAMELADALRGRDDRTSIASTVVHAVADRLGDVVVEIITTDDNPSRVVARAGRSEVTETIPEQTLVRTLVGVARSLAHDGSAAIDDTSSATTLTATARNDLSAAAIRSIMAHVLDERPDGLMLVVHRPDAHTWTAEERSIIDVTALRAQQALSDARHMREQHRRTSRATLRADLIAAIANTHTAESAMATLVSTLVPAVGDYATVEQVQPHRLRAIAHRDPAHLTVLRTLRTDHYIDDDDANSIARAAHGESQLIPTVTPALREEYALDPTTARLLSELAPRSHMAVPLTISDSPPLAVMIGVTDPERDIYSTDDLHFLEELARRFATELEAIRVRHAEHDAALSLQRSLLPTTLAWDASAVVVASYRPASDILEVGGDWYDTYQWPDGQLGVLVGDMVGHNLDSAIAMGRLRTLVAALAPTLPASPARVLDTCARFVRGPDGDSFATAACVVIDPRTNQLSYACAGHPPPLVALPSGATMWLDQAQGPPLCQLSPAAHREAVVQLDANAIVLLYTDGLVERRKESLDVGLDRLARFITARLHQPIQPLVNDVVNSLRGGTTDDDIAVAAFRYTPLIGRLELQAPAETSQLATIRSRIRDWLIPLSSHQDSGPIELGVGEACTNVIDHAYLDHQQPGDLSVSLAHHGHHVVATISDHGRWRQPGPHTQHRGFGTGIMQGVTVRFRRNTSPTGTTVTLVFDVSPSYSQQGPAREALVGSTSPGER